MIMKILVGYDRSKASEDALNLALQHARAFGAEVHIMTSLVQGAALKKEDIDKAEAQLEKVRKPFKAADIECEVHTSVSYQSPGEDMVRFAKDKAVDQIVIGVRRRSKVGKLVTGSTAQYVILNAPCPVLSVK
jgi:nucleotide-binding universal stress UspA family protein